ncbi:MAG: DUF427 domain-containing protein [Alphaproteobacteria bacterium]
MTDQDKERQFWRSVRRKRPGSDEIIKPGPGQESVWDYPRPPRIDSVGKPLRVVHANQTIAETSNGLRVVETAGAPVYYFPPADIDMSLLVPSPGSSFCEWKGAARYWAVTIADQTIEQAGWSYPEPTQGFTAIRDYIGFYAQKMDGCYVGDERATPQPGGFYGGWVTSSIVGPIKGEPGSEFW